MKKSFLESIQPGNLEIPDFYVTYPAYHKSRNPEILVPGNGTRLIRYDIENSRAFKFTDQHRNGYDYGFETIPYRSFSGFWGADPRNPENPMFRVRLKRPADIYVVDEQPFLDAREALKENCLEHNRSARNAEETAVFAAIARTIIPLSSYRRDFMRPIFLIGRPLSADEASPFDPPFRARLRNEEITRRARNAPAVARLMEEILGRNEKEPPRDRPDGPPPLKLV